jgi:hypothetical protein
MSADAAPGAGGGVPATAPAAPGTDEALDAVEEAEPAADAPDGGFAQSDSAAHFTPAGPAAGPARRFWSVRRVPAALLAGAVLATAGPLLYDVISVRAGRPAAAWRRRLADDLAHRAVDDAAVVAGAAAAVLIGAWLVVLAVAPGLRHVLPLRHRDGEDLRAGVERAAAAVVLRDRALDVSGVREVRVRVGRHRVRVLAEAHFRDLDEVRADLDAVLADALRDVGLARRPALSVHVRRPARR